VSRDTDPENDPAGDDTSFTTGRRRRYPFTMLPDWVLFSGVSPGAKALYWALAVHVNQERRDAHGDMRVWPGQDKLLHIAGIKSRTTLRKYLHELRTVGAVDWRTGRNPHNPLRTQTVYIVHEEPEPGYQGPASLTEVYAELRDKD
jgi:hypothetical protein